MSVSKIWNLSAWMQAFLDAETSRKPTNTLQAKRRDLTQFLAYFSATERSDNPDLWTKKVTKSFLEHLASDGARRPTTLNRVLSSLRQCAAWIDARRPFASGNPASGIRDEVVDEPTWKGLTKHEVAALRASMKDLTKRSGKNQCPLRDHAMVLTLLATGLRVTELLRLDRQQYDGHAFLNVERKGGRRSLKVRIPKHVAAQVNNYIAHERGLGDGALFVSKSGVRLERQHLDRVLKLAFAGVNHATGEPPMQPFSAQVLRHTVLRATTRQRGVSSGMKKGGHASPTYVWRYLRLSEEERREALDRLTSGNLTETSREPPSSNA